MKDLNTPIWQLTVAELVELLDSGKKDSKDQLSVIKEEKKEYVYGISGLAKILGCSKNHAGRLKSSGLLDGAILQNGRKIIIDKEKALELFNKKNA
ncbi:DUF3853 family protein [Elizabethkingia anophelis]|nr:DUF3853 family protein [Elizabethkingia anophelis]AQW96144.1 hypothetical protein BBD30_01515 [Elizabethkingia anophelis]OPB61475.1 hypothetical protein BAS07_16745 [Elizabethkingia anophelis]